MDISSIRVRKLFPEGKLKTIVSVTFDNAFVVHDIKVVEGHNGLFVAMPSRRTSSGEFRDIAHPISHETRGIIQNEVLKAYYQALADANFTSDEDMDEELCYQTLKEQEANEEDESD